MQFGKECVRRNSFYKCVINEETDLDSADVFEVGVVSLIHCMCFGELGVEGSTNIYKRRSGTIAIG